MRSFFHVLFVAGIVIPRILRAQVLTFGASDLELVLHPGIAHTEVTVPVAQNSQPYQGPLTVTADMPWVTPVWDGGSGVIRLRFGTNTPAATQTATLRVVAPQQTNEFFLHANLRDLNVVTLVADPVQPRVYALHASALERGSLVVYDPLAGRPLFSRTLPAKPTDLAAYADRRELVVIHTVSPGLLVLDSETLEPRERLPLAVFPNWGVNDTNPRLAIGSGQILYYTDGAWAPGLNVYNRATKQLLQTVQIDSNGTGDMAVSPDRSTLLAWAQYGWTAGWGGSYAARFSIGTNGMLTLRQTSSSQWPTVMTRDPLDTPVLFNRDGSRVWMKQLGFSPEDLRQPVESLPGPVYSISPGGTVAGTSEALHETAGGRRLFSLPGQYRVQAITADSTRLVYFDPQGRNLKTIDLIEALGPEVLGLELSPADESMVMAPTELQWRAGPGARGFHVYLGTNRQAVASAGLASPEYLGETFIPRLSLTNSWVPAATYFWRVDSLVDGSPVVGTIHSFTLSPFEFSLTQLQGLAVAGMRTAVASFEVSSASPGVAWEAVASEPWVSFSASSGVTPARIQVWADASQLPVGITNATLRVGPPGTAGIALPFRLRVSPLSVNHLKSSRSSKYTYGVSEDPTDPGARALALEIDTETETVTRTLEVGSSVTDLALHEADGRLYVPNWRSGQLLAINLDSFQVERTYPFLPFGQVGSSRGDVFRVTPGPKGWLVVEEADQWISLLLLNTETGGRVTGPSVREGGGASDPTGRFYYHGDNNHSGATIQKYEVGSARFVSQGSIRVEFASYYGSRVVTASGDGSRVFWNGGMFDENLALLWGVGEHVYSSTPDGRYAFGQSRIFDTSRRVHAYTMPAEGPVSAFHAPTAKLVVPVNGRLRYFPFAGGRPEMTAPVFGSTTVSAGAVNLTWTDRTLETGFGLQMRLAEAVAWTNVGVIPANQTAYQVTGLAPETAYEFRVRAMADGDSSPWGEVLRVSTSGNLPTAPELSLLNLRTNRVQLGWTQPLRHSGFILERIGLSSSRVDRQLFPPGASGYIDSTVIPGEGYRYVLTATNRWGQTTALQPVEVTIPVPRAPTVPAPPGVIVLAGLRTQVSWGQLPETEIVEVQRKAIGAMTWGTVARVDAAQGGMVDSNLVAGVTYQYRLVAENVIGRSDPSAAVNVYARALSLLAGETFASGEPGPLWDTISGGGVLRDDPGLKEGAALRFAGGGPREAVTVPVWITPNSVLDFEFRAGRAGDGPLWTPANPGRLVVVEYSAGGGPWLNLTQFPLNRPVGPVWGRYSSPELASLSGLSVRFRWRQLPDSDPGVDPWAIDNVRVTGATPPPPPPSPFVMITAGSPWDVSLFWVSVPGVQAYVVERSQGPAAWSTLAVVRGMENWFRDTNCLPGQAYAYRVRSAGPGGTSAPSMTVFGTTPGLWAHWQAENGGPAAVTPDSVGPDGWSHLSRYAFGLEAAQPLQTYRPDVPGAHGLPRIVVDSSRGAIEVSFARRKASVNPGVEYVVEVSSDLVVWTPCRQVSRVDLDPGWEAVTYLEEGAGFNNRFCRVFVRAAFP